MKGLRGAYERWYNRIDQAMDDAKKPRERRTKPFSRASYILKGARVIGLMGLAFYGIDREVSNLSIELVPALISTAVGATIGAGLGDLAYRSQQEQNKS